MTDANWCQKYMKFQFERSQGKKLAKRVKVIQKIEDFNFRRQKMVHFYKIYLKLLHLESETIVSHVRYIP